MSSSGKVNGRGAVAGVMTALCLSAVICALYAYLIKSGKCSDAKADYVISAAIGISAFVGSLASRIGKGRAPLAGAVIGVIYALLLTAIPVIAFPSEADWLKIGRIFAAAIAGGALGATVVLGKSNKSFRKSRKRRT